MFVPFGLGLKEEYIWNSSNSQLPDESFRNKLVWLIRPNSIPRGRPNLVSPDSLMKSGKREIDAKKLKLQSLEKKCNLFFLDFWQCLSQRDRCIRISSGNDTNLPIQRLMLYSFFYLSDLWETHKGNTIIVWTERLLPVRNLVNFYQDNIIPHRLNDLKCWIKFLNVLARGKIQFPKMQHGGWNNSFCKTDQKIWKKSI